MNTTYDFDSLLSDAINEALEEGTSTTTSSLEVSDGLAGMLAGVGIVTWILLMLVAVLMIVSYWKLFKKAGKPGWAAIVPIYNLWILYEVAGLPGWTALLGLIPVVGVLIMFVLNIIVAIKLPPKFGKEGIYSVGLIFLPVVFYPMLAFGKAEYVGEGAPAAAAAPAPEPTEEE